MIKNLLSKGKLTTPLVVYNRTKSRAEDLATEVGGNKITVEESIGSVVSGADIIFTCLGDDAAVKATIETGLRSDVAGKLFVDCSTIHPDTTKHISRIVTERGARFVAAPVFGAPAAAESGTLIIALAGPSEAVEKVRPYSTNVMGRAVIDFSDREPHNATLLKVIGNTLILNMIESVAEGLTLAEQSGLGVDQLHQFIELMFPGPYAAYSDRMRQGDYFKREKPLFAIDLAIKDASHALRVAESVGVKLPAVNVGKRHLQLVKDHQGATGDIAGIYGACRKESGLTFENDKH